MSDQDQANQSVGEIVTQLEETSLQPPEAPGLNAVNETPAHQATEVQDTSLVEVRSAGDLGKGVFAVHDIARGTRIISEAPLLVVKPSLVLGTLEEHVAGFCAAVQTLSAEELKTLDDLYRNPIRPNDATQQLIHEWLEQHGDKEGRKLNTRNLRRTTRYTITRFSIFVINGMRISGEESEGEESGGDKGDGDKGDGDENDGDENDGDENEGDENEGDESDGDESNSDESDDDGLFALYSRINHSCSPNVVKSYNSTIKRLNVHATRDIKAGDQVFTDYVDGTLHSKGWRRGALQGKWSFVCHCRACTETEEAKLRDQMMKLMNRLFLYETPEYQSVGLEGSEGPPQSLQQVLEVYEEITALLRHPAVDLQSISLCRIYRNCAKLSLNLDDIQKAKEYARKELEVEESIIGTETEHLRDDLVGAKYWLEHLEKVVSAGDVSSPHGDYEVLSLFE